MNQVALVGRITKDPILRKLSRDRVQTSIIIAINRNYKNTKGEIEADFILCSLFGRLAENTAKHCGKGSLIGLSGRIQSRTYEREDQSRVFVTEVIGDEVRFLSTKSRLNDDLYANSTVSNHQEIAESETDHFELPAQESKELPIM
ncbi:single-stranded DNA-binding protein [Sporosarcina sp. Marseille-Q4063]|uniref:single-stranded DNA-binding protein n=1 Tax=Sporosarcina sp. Marseille-Q4063 TaxID=2810514 RepID=UPI001BAE5BCE|nr:single-stranded DNA-binding protein [Sporosarcina sp. Marseille-Q4063]QUW21186.1 single-stranded DNA-binding protein [Sporosarcina sp. Marseille-Q4063]